MGILGFMISMSFLILLGMMWLDPNAADPIPDRAFFWFYTSLVILIWSIMEITRAFSVSMVYHDLNIDDDLINILEDTKHAGEELSALIHRMTISPDEVALIQQYRLATGDPRYRESNESGEHEKANSHSVFG